MGGGCFSNHGIPWRFAKQISMEVALATMELCKAKHEMVCVMPWNTTKYRETVCAPVKCSILNTVFSISSGLKLFFTRLPMLIFVSKNAPRNVKDFHFEIPPGISFRKISKGTQKNFVLKKLLRSIVLRTTKYINFILCFASQNREAKK